VDLSTAPAPAEGAVERYLSGMGFKSLVAQLASASAAVPSNEAQGAVGGSSPAAGAAVVGGVGGVGAGLGPRDERLRQRLMAEDEVAAAVGLGGEVAEVAGEYTLVTDMGEVEARVAKARQVTILFVAPPSSLWEDSAHWCVG